MSDCCATPANGKHACPACGHAASAVSANTMRFHLLQPWLWQEGTQHYFCAQQGCEVIYFDAAGKVWRQSELRTQVGVKHQNADALLCYCYGLHYGEVDADTRNYIVEQTRAGSCACSTHNPAGRCCLKDIPR